MAGSVLRIRDTIRESVRAFSNKFKVRVYVSVEQTVRSDLFEINGWNERRYARAIEELHQESMNCLEERKSVSWQSSES